MLPGSEHNWIQTHCT